MVKRLVLLSENLMQVQNMIKWICVLGIWGLLTFASTSVSAAAEVPEVVPAGWAVLDETTDIQLGLQTHYKQAVSAGRVPYVYLYSDRSRQCRAVRAMMHRADLQAAFSDVAVVMVNYYHWRRQYPASTTAFQAEFTPSIIRIAANGGLLGEVFSPALTLYYPELSSDPKLRRFSIKQKWSGPIPKRQFAQAMVRFFERNHRSGQ